MNTTAMNTATIGQSNFWTSRPSASSAQRPAPAMAESGPTEQVTLSGNANFSSLGPAVQEQAPNPPQANSLSADESPTRQPASGNAGHKLDVLTVFDHEVGGLAAPGVDILSTVPKGPYRSFVGTVMSLPGGGEHFVADAATSPEKRASMIVAEAKRQGVTIEEAESHRLTFATSDGSRLEDPAAFRKETRAAVDALAKEQGLPVAWESFDKIDKDLWSLTASPYGGILAHSFPQERKDQFNADVQAWVQDHNSRARNAS